MSGKVLLKLSGTALCSDNNPIDIDILSSLADKISSLVACCDGVAIVLGGGNIWRGGRTDKMSLPRIESDYTGMMATIVNSIALHSALQKSCIKSTVMSSLCCGQFVEPYSIKTATSLLNQKEIVILAGGIGRPFFSTDTCAALSSSELGITTLLKATNVDGLYTKDPNLFPDAQLIKHGKLTDMVGKPSIIFDQAAISICIQNNITVKIFSLKEPNLFAQALSSHSFGTTLIP